jgi:hypothetical protein
MDDLDPGGSVLPDHRDNFKKIKKITQPVASALYELGLNRYADLARLTSAQLADMLQVKKVRFVSAELIEREDWVGQARDLASQAAQTEELTLSNPDLEAEPVQEDQDVPAASTQSDPPTRASAADWHELGDFFVSFGETSGPGGEKVYKTKVNHSQSGQDMKWDGIVSEALVEWMLDHCSPPLTAHSGASVEELPQPGSEAEEPLEVTDVWVAPVDPADLPPRQAAQRMIRVEANINLAEEELREGLLAWPASFAVSIYLVNTQTGEAVFIDTPAVEAFPDALPYAFQQDFIVPPPGRYQLYLLARLTPPGSGVALRSGPIVRVEG